MFRYEVGALTRVFQGDFGRKKVVDGWGCSRLFAKFGQLLPQSGSGRVGCRKGAFAEFGAREVLDFGVG